MAGRLYPPIVNYAMPAFVGDTVRIYFAIPSYNGEVNYLQMTVRYLDSNENALSSTYKGKVKAYNGKQTDLDRVSRQDKYYVELNSSDLAEGFKTDTIYKIQLRFSSTYNASNPDTSWINSNLSNFSEWSQVTLIRKIDTPTYEILGLESANSGAEVNFTSVDSVFTIVYNGGESAEPLQSWRTILYNEDKSEILADSGWKDYNNYDYLPVDSSNSISFESILPYVMVKATNYVLTLFIKTRNGYQNGNGTDYSFTCNPVVSTEFNGAITQTINEEEGYAKILVISYEAYSTNIILRRTSSKSNFSVWEDIALKSTLNEFLNWEFLDFTIESGIFYRYGVQIKDTYGRRGPLTVISTIEMGEFNNAFLLEEDNKQLKLKYDFSISSMNVNIAESKTDTIGSKYPFIRRNGTMYYRTFQCSGLITGYMDMDEHIFTSNAEILDNQVDRYAAIQNGVNTYVNQYDYTYERKFREKVQEFLYDNKVKLFKSLQEGNILVKLMNISLTPKNELGRLLYSFSAQAIEIDEADLETLHQYNIQPVATYSSSITFSQEQLGQLSCYTGYDKRQINNNWSMTPVYTFFPKDQNLISLIGEKYGWQYDSNGGVAKKSLINGNIKVNDFQLSYLRIELESEPYLIVKSNTSLRPLDGSSNQIGSNEELILGWIINILDTNILVSPPNNIYELNDNDLVIQASSNISFPKDTAATIQYIVSLSEEVSSSEVVPISLKYNKIIGQLNKLFQPNTSDDDIIQLLKKKYDFDNDVQNKKYLLDTVYWLDIEADPGSIFYVQTSTGDNINKFVMNDTGNLFVSPENESASITQMYFTGKQIDIRYLYPIYDWESEIEHTNKAINKFNLEHYKTEFTTNVVPYDYYENDGQYFMYYNRQWCPCEITDGYLFELTCPVQAIVNYEIRQQEGEYQ